MSRSVRKTPTTSWCSISAGTQSAWKRQEHRAERNRVKDLLKQEQYDALPHPKEYGNEWASPRDGKMRFDNLKNKSCTKYCKPNDHFICHHEYKKLMRK